ncbi:hypothetical protein AGMMS50256_19380 [Betaproteobacteria bacterium]|nr:hypothetical protein AGMMS50256_19380 [Betaproteobacteria bacterium]
MAKKKPTTEKSPALSAQALEEYTVQGEPGQRERSYYWKTAIGLQAVDGIKPSDYLIATANENIRGDITLDEAERRIESYYKTRPAAPDEDRTEEADKVLKNRELLAVPDNDVIANVGDNVGEKADMKSLILANLKERPELSAKELAASLGKTSRTIERHIKELREQGILVRIGADRGGHWKMKNS